MLTSNIIDLRHIKITPSTPQLSVFQHVLFEAEGEEYYGCVIEARAWFGLGSRYAIDYKISGASGTADIRVDYERGTINLLSNYRGN